VTRDVLETSGVSSSFMDKVEEKAKEKGIDARELIKAMKGGEVLRFRKDAIDY
jgi:hypothetical protein